MYKYKFSILIPTYNRASIIKKTLDSILSQKFDNFEIIVNDNASVDNTKEVIKSYSDNRIRYYCNARNLGYPSNLEEARKKAKGDIIYLMGDDDILSKNALLNTYNAFLIDDNIGAVTRPYFWFRNDIETPVREEKPLNSVKNEIVTIDDSPEKIIMVFKTLGQLSGLAYKTEYMDLQFHEDIFTCHIYPFFSILKKHPIVFLKDYTVAVRISTSISKTVSSTYNKSPLQSWIDLFNNVFCEVKFKQFREQFIKNYIAVNYVGLLQIKNYAKYKYLWREIFLLLKYRWYNIFNAKFWFFSLGCIIIPSFILIPLIDFYKNRILSKKLTGIKFKYKM
jgi:glycosyltransferase involved in cell wall biosynthesis